MIWKSCLFNVSETIKLKSKIRSGDKKKQHRMKLNKSNLKKNL